ncbi:MAG: carboxypeptidase regulatory-like domain-containing protein [Gemmatimonadales bacterium]
MRTIILAASAALVLSAPPAPGPVLSGVVADGAGRPVGGVMVVAARAGREVRHAAVSDAGGRFTISVPDHGPFRVGVDDPRFEGAPATDAVAGPIVRLSARPRSTPLHSSAAWLNQFPEGRERRWFILDCTGCHQFNETRSLRNGVPRPADAWHTDVDRMLTNFGPQSGFPIIGGAPGELDLVAWLLRHNRGRAEPAEAPQAATGFTVTEYDLPGPDLPHDVAVDSSGGVVVTGMFTHRLLVLDPATGGITTIPIPVPNANPRAIEVDRGGDWWVLLGGPGKVARYRPGADRWDFADFGRYAHSIGVGANGQVWANDHFAVDSLRLARVTPGPALGLRVETGPLPRGDAIGPSPIPYELRVGPDGVVWVSLLHGSRLVSFDPRTGRWDSIALPERDAGPRRFDVGPDGILWIPSYSGSALFRLDPRTRQFERVELPIPNSLPYVARVSPTDGSVWIGTAAADVVYHYTPRDRRIETIRVPTRGASMRHLTIDPRTGAVWIASGPRPRFIPPGWRGSFRTERGGALLGRGDPGVEVLGQTAAAAAHFPGGQEPGAVRVVEVAPLVRDEFPVRDRSGECPDDLALVFDFDDEWAGHPGEVRRHQRVAVRLEQRLLHPKVFRIADFPRPGRGQYLCAAAHHQLQHALFRPAEVALLGPVDELDPLLVAVLGRVDELAMG